MRPRWTSVRRTRNIRITIPKALGSARSMPRNTRWIPQKPISCCMQPVVCLNIFLTARHPRPQAPGPMLVRSCRSAIPSHSLTTAVWLITRAIAISSTIRANCPMAVVSGVVWQSRSSNTMPTAASPRLCLPTRVCSPWVNLIPIARWRPRRWRSQRASRPSRTTRWVST